MRRITWRDSAILFRDADCRKGKKRWSGERIVRSFQPSMACVSMSASCAERLQSTCTCSKQTSRRMASTRLAVGRSELAIRTLSVFIPLWVDLAGRLPNTGMRKQKGSDDVELLL